MPLRFARRRGTLAPRGHLCPPFGRKRHDQISSRNGRSHRERAVGRPGAVCVRRRSALVASRSPLITRPASHGGGYRGPAWHGGGGYWRGGIWWPFAAVGAVVGTAAAIVAAPFVAFGNAVASAPYYAPQHSRSYYAPQAYVRAAADYAPQQQYYAPSNSITRRKATTRRSRTTRRNTITRRSPTTRRKRLRAAAATRRHRRTTRRPTIRRSRPTNARSRHRCTTRTTISPPRAAPFVRN